MWLGVHLNERVFFIIDYVLFVRQIEQVFF